MKHYCVVGSLNMDMVTRVRRFPRPGETVTGLSFSIYPGGKGGNQAVAMRRLGASVEMIGAVGDDSLGADYRNILTGAGVGTSCLHTFPGVSTGTATIAVNGQGENHIIVVTGANGRVTPKVVRAHKEIIAASAVLLLQLEIPMESVIEAARVARSAGVTVILDPAPARELSAELLSLVSMLTPNETEAGTLSGADTGSEAGIEEAARSIRGKFGGVIVIKAGSQGAFVMKGSEFSRHPGFPVETVDTVAAGDAFNAALAYAIGEGMSIRDSIDLANAAGAISTTKEGAQSALPTLDEARGLLSDSPADRRR